MSISRAGRGNTERGNTERKSIKIARASSRRMPHVARARCCAWNLAPIQPSIKSIARTTGSNPPIDVAPPPATSLVAPRRSSGAHSRLWGCSSRRCNAIGNRQHPFSLCATLQRCARLSVQPFVHPHPSWYDMHSVPSISTAAADANSSPNQRY